MTAVRLRVPGMTSRPGVRRVTAVLRDVVGVERVQADLTTMTVVLHGDAVVRDVLAQLAGAGFPATVIA
jgi:copper chaperone CopZ